MPKSRDAEGRFRSGHGIGRKHRFKPGCPSPNPQGRPRGVKSWMRELRSRRYHQGELEDVLIDEQAPANKREAAMWLLLPYHEARPPKPTHSAAVADLNEELDHLDNETLRWIIVDPSGDPNERAAAHMLLSERDTMQPPPDRLAWMHHKSVMDQHYDRTLKAMSSIPSGSSTFPELLKMTRDILGNIR